VEPGIEHQHRARHQRRAGRQPVDVGGDLRGIATFLNGARSRRTAANCSNISGLTGCRKPPATRAGQTGIDADFGCQNARKRQGERVRRPLDAA